LDSCDEVCASDLGDCEKLVVCVCVWLFSRKKRDGIGCMQNILTRDPLALPRGKTCDASRPDFLFDDDDDDDDDDSTDTSPGLEIVDSNIIVVSRPAALSLIHHHRRD
jgi:hypothetical protein